MTLHWIFRGLGVDPERWDLLDVRGRINQ
jgi:hypothetical protein